MIPWDMKVYLDDYFKNITQENKDLMRVCAIAAMSKSGSFSERKLTPKSIQIKPHSRMFTTRDKPKGFPNAPYARVKYEDADGETSWATYRMEFFYDLSLAGVELEDFKIMCDLTGAEASIDTLKETLYGDD